MLPNDPFMLLSYINTQLRDFYPSLDEFCNSNNISQEEIETKLKTIDYYYDAEKNKFV